VGTDSELFTGGDVSVKKMNTDHIVLHTPKGLLCEHCGQEQGISYPIAITVIAAMGAAFRKLHKHCTKKDIYVNDRNT